MSTDLLSRIFPEVAAGGFTRVDGTIEFYGRINALLNPSMTVLNFGAGRGAPLFDDRSPYRGALTQLRGKVRSVIGVDIDPAVSTNPDLDRWFLVGRDGNIPLENSSIDLIFSDFVFEHVEHPTICAAELHRILKPGGWLCARTPNKWNYVSIIARIVPNRLHQQILARVQPEREEADVFPTYHRMNDVRTIRRLFPPALFENASYVHNPEPAYLPRTVAFWRIGLFIARLLPESFSGTLMIFLRKRDDKRIAPIPT